MAGLPAALLVLVVVFFTTEIKGVAYGVPRFQGHYHVPPPDPSVRHKRAPPSQFVMQYPSGISCASSCPSRLFTSHSPQAQTVVEYVLNVLASLISIRVPIRIQYVA